MTIATSVRYGNYKGYLNNALFFIETITEKFEEICNHIILPRKLFIHIRPITGNYHGKAFVVRDYGKSYYGKEYVVEVDARQNVKDFKDTILHELVHIEQFYQKRLCDRSSFPGHFKWNNELISYLTPTMEEYNNLPWEREAIERADKIRRIIFK